MTCLLRLSFRWLWVRRPLAALLLSLLLVSCSVQPVMHHDGFYGVELTTLDGQESDPPGEKQGQIMLIVAFIGGLLLYAAASGNGKLGD